MVQMSSYQQIYQTLNFMVVPPERQVSETLKVFHKFCQEKERTGVEIPEIHRLWIANWNRACDEKVEHIRSKVYLAGKAAEDRSTEVLQLFDTAQSITDNKFLCVWKFNDVPRA